MSNSIIFQNTVIRYRFKQMIYLQFYWKHTKLSDTRTVEHALLSNSCINISFIAFELHFTKVWLDHNYIELQNIDNFALVCYLSFFHLHIQLYRLIRNDLLQQKRSQFMLLFTRAHSKDRFKLQYFRIEYSLIFNYNWRVSSNLIVESVNWLTEVVE